MASLGTGTTVEFAGSGGDGFFAEVTDIKLPEGAREKVDVSHMLTTGYRASDAVRLLKWGTLDISILFDPSKTPPFSAGADDVTITFPNGATWEFVGWISKYAPKVPLEDRMTADVSLAVSGKVEFNPAS